MYYKYREKRRQKMRGCYHQQVKPVAVALGVFLFFLFIADRIFSKICSIRLHIVIVILDAIF